MQCINLARMTLVTPGTVSRLPSFASQRLPNLSIRAQCYSTQTRASTLRKVRSPTLKERAMAPAGEGAFTMGRGLLAGASAVGLGALCYYGLGMSNELGAIDKAGLWPEVVKHRIRDTYLYFGSSLAFTAASAVAVSRSPAMMRLVTKNSWLAIIGSVAAMWGTGILCQALPYTEGIGAKQLAWALHSAVVGAVVAPITILGGPILVRAACYTAGIVGSLSTLAVCAPSDKFLCMGGPLAMGLGVVFVSSIGTMFLPASTALGAGFASIAMYGGLVLFGAFLLYDTQKIIYRAENHPVYATQRYDPINNSVGIYLDTVNIFIRVAMLLAGGGNRRK